MKIEHIDVVCLVKHHIGVKSNDNKRNMFNYLFLVNQKIVNNLNMLYTKRI